MSNTAPPQWLERILISLLQPRDRETIPGDLAEEFRHRRSKQLGPLRASVWYARQVLSFLPRQAVIAKACTRSLTAVCLFTGLAGLWLGSVDWYWKHPGYGSREWIPAVIVGQALLTLAALGFRSSAVLRHLAMLGTLPLLWLAGKVAIARASGSDIEGYILLLALVLIAQTLLTLYTLLAQRQRRELKP